MKERCPFCGQVAEMIWVRAHYQCAVCGQVTMACCNGETARACPVEAAPESVDPAARSEERTRPVTSAGKGG